MYYYSKFHVLQYVILCRHVIFSIIKRETRFFCYFRDPNYLPIREILFFQLQITKKDTTEQRASCNDFNVSSIHYFHR